MRISSSFLTSSFTNSASDCLTDLLKVLDLFWLVYDRNSLSFACCISMKGGACAYVIPLWMNRVIRLGSSQVGFVTEFSRKHSLASSGLGSVHMEWVLL